MRKRLDSFNRNSVSTEDMLGSCKQVRSESDHSKYETKTFRSKTFMEFSVDNQDPDMLSKSQNSEDLKQIKGFQKQHRRMRSHETVDRSFFLNGSKESSLSGKSSALSETSGRSSALSEISGKSSVLSHGNLYSSLSKDSEDDLLGPSVNMSDIIRKANELGSDELPEGWQEVQDGAELYYWHIWTGTIQYERPTRSSVSIYLTF